MITEIDDWTLFSSNNYEEINNRLKRLCLICDNNDGQPIHIYLTRSSELSEDLHKIMTHFTNRHYIEYEYTITTTVKNDRPRVVLNIRWKQDEEDE